MDSDLHLLAHRTEAGRRLARLLSSFDNVPDLLVLALPRGGVPVAVEVAHALGAPLDICVVRKLGVPGNEEMAMGAITSDGIRILNQPLIDALGIGEEVIEDVIQRERKEAARRERLYRAGAAPLDVHGRTVILVDDGLATGSSMLAAVAAMRLHGARRIVVAVPVASSEACAALERVADRCVCLITPSPFQAVGAWYETFPQVSDDEVVRLLRRGAQDGHDPL